MINNDPGRDRNRTQAMNRESQHPEAAASRREFLRTAGRWGGAVGLVALLAWLERPGRVGICLDAPVCAGCPALVDCTLPEGEEERRRQEREDQLSAAQPGGQP
ncbi:MAG: hypothetical protein D6766_01635 [Verrucomicrobia bacterium]|nr:MAG: hypothetical protein D6766_01635 [Verrucomicrobiota bacterium]